MGRAFPIGIIPLRSGGGGTYYSQPIPIHQPPPQYTPTYYAHQSPPGGQMSQSVPPATVQYPPITPQQIQEMIRQALAEQKKADTIEELKKMIYELEKKQVEDRAEMEKKLADTAKVIMNEVTKMIDDSLKEIKDMISSLQSSQPSQASQESITKKDLELMRVEMEKRYLQEKAELEKKLLETKSEAEKKEILSQLQELRAKLDSLEKGVSTPISPEGWKTDEARLVAELGGRFLDIVRDRRPMEYLIKIIPQKPPSVERKTESSIEELIREAGGEVE
jgi:hypothetical protein